MVDQVLYSFTTLYLEYLLLVLQTWLQSPRTSSSRNYHHLFHNCTWAWTEGTGKLGVTALGRMLELWPLNGFIHARRLPGLSYLKLYSNVERVETIVFSSLNSKHCSQLSSLSKHRGHDEPPEAWSEVIMILVHDPIGGKAGNAGHGLGRDIP